jgi:hypothetical protein
LLRYRLIIILVALAICLALSGCTSPTPGPSSGYGSYSGTKTNPSGGYATDTSPSGSASTGAMVPENAYTSSAADAGASASAVMDAASAILFNDPDAFTGLMSAETLAHVSGTPDLTTPEAKTIGEALQNARIVNAAEDAFVYETTIDGVTITFMVVKEDGAWKISGL